MLSPSPVFDRLLHVLCAAVGIGFFVRYRTLPTLLAALGFLAFAVGDMASAWAAARWAGLAGVWVASFGLWWHVFSSGVPRRAIVKNVLFWIGMVLVLMLVFYWGDGIGRT